MCVRERELFGRCLIMAVKEWAEEGIQVRCDITKKKKDRTGRLVSMAFF